MPENLSFRCIHFRRDRLIDTSNVYCIKKRFYGRPTSPLQIPPATPTARARNHAPKYSTIPRREPQKEQTILCTRAKCSPHNTVHLIRLSRLKLSHACFIRVSRTPRLHLFFRSPRGPCYRWRAK